MGDNTALKKKQFFSLYQFVNSKALTQGLKKICFVCKFPDLIYGPHKGFSYWLVTSLYVPFICAQEGHTYLFSSSVLFVQANANMSLLASFATEAILNCDHPNSHSASSPAAMALQYTTERRLGWILKRLQLTQ